MGKYKNIGFPSPLNPHVGSGDFDENRVGVGHPTWVDPLVDLSLLPVFTRFGKMSDMFGLKVSVV